MSSGRRWGQTDMGGLHLHEWAFATRAWREQQGLEGGEDGAYSDVVAAVTRDVGAYVMGRRMFGGGEGAWDEDWMAGGAPTPRTTGPCSCSPTTSASR